METFAKTRRGLQKEKNRKESPRSEARSGDGGTGKGKKDILRKSDQR